MYEVRPGIKPKELQDTAKHTLFVEGQGQNSLDHQIVDFFFKQHGVHIRVVPLGPSFHVHSVAEALYPYHPDYYFLIDRDYRDIDTVERSWKNFPDPQTKNLLIWRRREIENYFLDPEYLQKSNYLSCSFQKLKECITITASQRLFLDIANLIILQCEKEVRRECIAKFSEHHWNNGFTTKEEALRQLQEKHEEAKRLYNGYTKLHAYPIVERFHAMVDDFLGGQTRPPILGKGSWLSMVHGKYVFQAVVDKCFRVGTSGERFLQGPERVREVAKDLLRLPLAEQPTDFQELHMLISKRITS
jgi:hypothetical protein